MKLILCSIAITGLQIKFCDNLHGIDRISIRFRPSAWRRFIKPSPECRVSPSEQQSVQQYTSSNNESSDLAVASYAFEEALVIMRSLCDWYGSNVEYPIRSIGPPGDEHYNRFRTVTSTRAGQSITYWKIEKSYCEFLFHCTVSYMWWPYIKANIK